MLNPAYMKNVPNISNPWNFLYTHIKTIQKERRMMANHVEEGNDNIPDIGFEPSIAGKEFHSVVVGMSHMDILKAMTENSMGRTMGVWGCDTADPWRAAEVCGKANPCGREKDAKKMD